MGEAGSGEESIFKRDFDRWRSALQYRMVCSRVQQRLSKVGALWRG